MKLPTRNEKDTQGLTNMEVFHRVYGKGLAYQGPDLTTARHVFLKTGINIAQDSTRVQVSIGPKFGEINASLPLTQEAAKAILDTCRHRQTVLANWKKFGLDWEDQP